MKFTAVCLKRKVPVTVSCLHCNKSFPKSHLEIGVSITRIVSGSLSNHLSARGKDACFNFYTKNYVNENNGEFDYYASLSSRDKQEHRELFSSKRTNTTNSFSPSNFGLTGTANGPIPINHPDFHLPNLNKQTIYDANQLQVSRDVISNNIELDCSSEHTAVNDQDPPDNHLPYDYATGVVPILAETNSISRGSFLHNATSGETDTITENENIVPDPIIIEEMNPNLSSEVELLNICRHLRSPLNGSRLIWQWAMKCQQKKGFDFARLPHCRTRGTVLKDVRNHVKAPAKDNFDKKILKWLPSKDATEVCVCSFKTALFLLLTKTQLVVEENISLPHSRNPYSYENYPPVDIISELHHGNWWTRTWAKRCVES